MTGGHGFALRQTCPAQQSPVERLGDGSQPEGHGAGESQCADHPGLAHPRGRNVR